jgi:hypothetical protein
MKGVVAVTASIAAVSVFLFGGAVAQQQGTSKKRAPQLTTEDVLGQRSIKSGLLPKRLRSPRENPAAASRSRNRRHPRGSPAPRDTHALRGSIGNQA